MQYTCNIIMLPYFLKKKILYLYQRTNFKFQRNLGSTTKIPKHFCISFRQHHNCKQINCMICLLLLCCYGIEMYRSQVSYIEYSTARGFNQALVARYKQNLHRQINLDNQCILIIREADFAGENFISVLKVVTTQKKRSLSLVNTKKLTLYR